MHDFFWNIASGKRSPEARLGGSLLISTLLHVAVIMSPGAIATGPSAPVAHPQRKITVTLVSASPANVRLKHAQPAGESARANPISVPLPPAPRYFQAREVDVPAHVINDVMLHYPPSAYQQRISGEVTLKLFINQAGEVDEVAVVASEPKELFDEAAVNAAKQLRYSPALKDGTEVGSTKTIVITFDPTTNPL